MLCRFSSSPSAAPTRSAGRAFDEIQNDKLNANSPVNNARGVPKARIRQHEFGFNLGGPIIQNRLFFFGNYEQIVPGTTVLTRTVLTQEATQGVFRYVATDGSTQTANLLQIAAANGFRPRSIRSSAGSCS